MRSIKKPVKYKSLSLPEPLFNEMKDHATKSPKYRNMAELLRVAIKEKMERDKLFLVPPSNMLKPEFKRLAKEFGVGQPLVGSEPKPQDDPTHKLKPILNLKPMIMGDAPPIGKNRSEIQELKKDIDGLRSDINTVLNLLQQGKKKKDNNVNGHGLS